MAKIFSIATEELLEVEKLIEAEKVANKTGMFDKLADSVKQDQHAKEITEDAIETEDVDQADNDTGEAGDEEDIGDGQPSGEDKEALESLMSITHETVATEDFSDTAASVGGFIKDVAFLVGHGVVNVATILANLGIKYTPIIAKHLYAGFVYTFTKLVKYSIKGGHAANQYVYRHAHSFEHIKKNIATLRATLTSIKEAKSDADVSTIKYSNRNVINALKIGGSVDLKRNMGVLTRFVSFEIHNLDENIKRDLASVRYMLSNYASLSTPEKFLDIPASSFGLVNGGVPGYEYDQESLDAYHYKDILPADTVFIAYIPKPDLNDIDKSSHAYNQSKMFLGHQPGSFKPIETIDYMTTDGLMSYLGELDALCDLCISHQRLYESVKKDKAALGFSFKHYFLRIANNVDRTSRKASLVDYIYLKGMFVDKLYLPAAMNIHDYTARVMTSALTYVGDNVKKLA